MRGHRPRADQRPGHQSREPTEERQLVGHASAAATQIFSLLVFVEGRLDRSLAEKRSI
jgi:hypothetical protein